MKQILFFAAIILSTSAFSFAQSWSVPYGKSYSGFEIDADSTHDYDVLSYALTLFPYYYTDRLSATVFVELRPMIPDFSSLFLHSEGITINTIHNTSGQILQFAYQPGGINIDLGYTYQPGDTFLVAIDYTAPLVLNYSQVGFHNWNGYTFTFAEPYGARRWFPCYDLPFDKATASLHIEVPLNYHAAANGTLMDSINTASHIDYVWIENHPIATYLISFAAGPYIHLTDASAAGRQLNYYVYPQDSAQAVYDFANTGDMVDFFSELFGDYPFDHYGMAMAHIFNGWGAMEHQSVTTYGDNLVAGDRRYEYIVSHELSHQWWGDALTPLTFADIWLNEGFASYCEALYIEARYDTLDEHMADKAQSYFAEDQVIRYPIYNPPANYLFGAAVYCKGAWVLHMLRYVMGDSAFFNGWQNYFEAYKYGNVATAEFQAAMEAEYGPSLDWFFQEWVYEAGYPEYVYEWDILTDSTDDSEVLVILDQVQTNAPIFSMPVQFYFTDGIDDSTVTLWNNEPFSYFYIDLPFSPTEMTFDPGNHILKTAEEYGVENLEPNRPLTFELLPCYPNPFNSFTTINFTLDRAGEVKLAVYDVLGREVAEFGKRKAESGRNTVVWEADGVGSGVYFVRLELLQSPGTLQHSKQSRVRKVALIK